jgi:N-acetyl-gamma-glutamyl-phosphate reductase
MLENAPMFSPIVDDFYSGMEMTVQLFASQLNDGFTIEDIKKVYSELYTSPALKYVDEGSKGFLAAGELSGADNMKVSVFGNNDRIILTAVYDNLGKGASGAAIQCMNIMLGTDEYKGLVINEI